MPTSEHDKDGGLQRELGKISATLDEILRRLDKHAIAEEKLVAKIENSEAHYDNVIEKLHARVNYLENKLNYGLGALAAALFVLEFLVKFIKV